MVQLDLKNSIGNIMQILRKLPFLAMQIKVSSFSQVPIRFTRISDAYEIMPCDFNTPFPASFKIDGMDRKFGRFNAEKSLLQCH